MKQNKDNSELEAPTETSRGRLDAVFCYAWVVRVRRGTSGYDECIYNSMNRKPVTAEHVRTSPSVRKFIGKDRLCSISPKRDTLA